MTFETTLMTLIMTLRRHLKFPCRIEYHRHNSIQISLQNRILPLWLHLKFIFGLESHRYDGVKNFS